MLCLFPPGYYSKLLIRLYPYLSIRHPHYFSASSGVLQIIESTAWTGPCNSSHNALYTNCCRCTGRLPSNILDITSMAICDPFGSSNAPRTMTFGVLSAVLILARHVSTMLLVSAEEEEDRKSLEPPTRLFEFIMFNPPR